MQFYKSDDILTRGDDILKWKPASLSSIDFRLEIETQTGPGSLPTLAGNLFVGFSDIPFGQLEKVSSFNLFKNFTKLESVLYKKHMCIHQCFYVRYFSNICSLNNF